MAIAAENTNDVSFIDRLTAGSKTFKAPRDRSDINSPQYRECANNPIIRSIVVSR